MSFSTPKPWSGRFTKPTEKSAEAFTASIAFDRRLAPYDIAGSIAHARMLGRQGIITPQEAEAIVAGLEEIGAEIEGGQFPFREELEDIHMNIEARLAEKIGTIAGKLHTARSRNDQVALDIRLYVKDAIAHTMDGLNDLQRSLLDQAEANLEVIIPGYTHLQRAQPVLLAHHLLAYFQMLNRDLDRFRDCLKRTDVMPLGSGALAGVPYPIDREFVSKELGFARISENSIDAVSDRDFVVEYQAAASIAIVHLSRLAEEIVLWSTSEFGFVEMDDAYATGSSIMPQKKNPDIAELVRGKTGRVFGHLMAILTTLKGLPLSYNRDLQEDKEGLFDTVDTLLASLEVFTGMIKTLRFRPEAAKRSLNEGHMLATDVADYLATKGLPFREAHHVVGNLVQYAIENEYHRFSPLFDGDVLKLTPEASVAARDVPGGTAPRRVREALAEARRVIGS
ncbi:MAG: argH [Dehalococcoidia bacterium]|nr:argH [Dehalococcoidia bacterium]